MGSKLCGIYKITNKINNKMYIGQSKDIINRWDKHKNELNSNKHKNDYLQKSWNKYGEENFDFEIIVLCEPAELNRLEKHYIDKYDTFNNDKKGYNLQSGGDFPQVSETTKEKISKANSGKIFTKEHKNNISKSRMKMKNKTGIHRVTKVQDKTCLQGFRWVYGYNDGNKRIEISRIDLEDLKNEIISQGLEWVINDEKIAKKTLEKDKNKIKLKKTLSEDHKKKLSEIAKVEQYGIKNPQAKYTL